MLVETEQMMPITRLQKELTQTVRDVGDSGKAVYILKNNNMEAVLLSYQEYEYLKDIEEIFEQFEIKNVIDEMSENRGHVCASIGGHDRANEEKQGLIPFIEARQKNYNSKKNISWETIRESD